MFYFLKEDLNILEAEIANVKAKVLDSQREMGESVEQSSESWHDNFGYEEGRRQTTLWSNRLSELMYVRSKIRMIAAPVSSGRVQIGSLVTVRDLDGEREFKVRIGSYMTKDRDGHLSISYTAPLAKLLLDSAVGDRPEGEIGGQAKQLEIISIE